MAPIGAPQGGPLLTFGDLARDRLAIDVTCANCGHRRILDGNSPRLRTRRVAGARFRCEECGSIGLPTIGQAVLGKQRSWPGKAAAFARRKLQKPAL